MGLNPHVVGRFFRAVDARKQTHADRVLIPMWWGGFSEELGIRISHRSKGLNPHVVGRFFREQAQMGFVCELKVLIPMWWGGFSEVYQYIEAGAFLEVLIPMWWGGFSESGWVFSLLNSAG